MILLSSQDHGSVFTLSANEELLAAPIYVDGTVNLEEFTAVNMDAFDMDSMDIFDIQNRLIAMSKI